jgi:tetratricopeptide (TPR) repeat protein
MAVKENFFQLRGIKKGVFHTKLYKERKMKIKIALIVFVAIGIVFYGCVGSPSGSSSQISTNLEGFTPSQNPINLEFNLNTSQQPTYNEDGSVTLFSTGNFQFKIMPMSFGNSRGAAREPTLTTEVFNELIQQYEADLAANPNDFDACMALASLYLDIDRRGDADKAIKYSNQAFTIRQGDPDALYARGLAYYKNGDYPNALSDLQMVLRTNIQSMKSVYYTMGMIYSMDGDIDQAIKAFEKVKAFDPEFEGINAILEDLYRYNN